jgi:cell shape-determining protein MreD
MLVIVGSAIVTGIVTGLIFDIEDDTPVSSNITLLVLLALTMIRHSVVRHTLSKWSPTCVLITPMPTMLYATQHLISGSMGPRAQIGIICTTNFRYPWEGQWGEPVVRYIHF